MYVIVARYHAKAETAAEVVERLTAWAVLARAEPGCRTFDVNQSVDDPRQVLLYERYDDEAAFQAHATRPEFETIVKATIWPLLESRSREIYTAHEPT